MKNIIFITVVIVFVMVSCNPKNKQAETTNTLIMKNDSKMNSAQSSNASINEVVANYLKLKNNLVNDNSKEAANSGNALVTTIGKVDMNSISKEQMKDYMDIADDAKEHAEHIVSNGGDIAHQREHFVMLSKDVNDLIQLFGTNQKLYQDFCPMADDNKGAIWISETKEIKNPYFGSQMATCGSIKKEF
ncbi:DUF3347 domain-containing protein [Flavobacterium sp. GSA192]|uniref:DUF3347 domain-containing protein n=1 Tax=Flavobacterium sp. GSA192 TaxID=2576304 RepID=UPI00112D4917|nr:DUF3347 domain-containing protein [Flavobacterium sp. GSA192]